MAEKLRGLRWLGPGVLHIRVGDAVTVVPPEGPKSLVHDRKQLEALGAERIQELIDGGQAKVVSLVEGALETVKDALGVTDPEVDEDLAAGQKVVSEAAGKSAAERKLAEAAAKSRKGEQETPAALSAVTPQSARAPGLSDGREQELDELTKPAGPQEGKK